MHQLARHLSRSLIIVLMHISLVGCATGPKMVYHGIGFNSAESVDVDILDWQYGTNNAENGGQQQFDTRARVSQVAVGKPFNSGGTTGGMPVGDFIYVKWRIKTTGEILEDKADMTKLLPRDMTFYRLHFVVKESQLYIYLIPPAPPGAPPFNDPGISQQPWQSGYYLEGLRGNPRAIEYFKKHQIYPN